MTWTIKLHDSVSSTTLWHHTRGSHDKEKKNAKGFPSCSWLPVTLNLGANCPSVVPSVSQSASVWLCPCNVGGLCSESLLLVFLSGTPGNSITPLSSCCVVKALPPQHGTETGVSWVCFVLGTCRILSGKMKFNVTFSVPLRQVGSAPYSHADTGIRFSCSLVR